MSSAKWIRIIPQDVKKDLRKLKRIWNKRNEGEQLIVKLHEKGVSFSIIGNAIGFTKQGIRRIYVCATGGGDRV